MCPRRLYSFCPRDAMLARLLAMALCLSVCLSVCMSVTSRCSVERDELINLVFWHVGFCRHILPTLCFKETQVSTKTRVLRPSVTFS